MSGSAGRSRGRTRDVHPPDLPAELEELEGEVGSGAALDGVRAGRGLVVAPTAHDVVVSESVLEGVDLRNRRLTGLRGTDVQLVDCDLAGAVLDHAVLHRVSFQGCHLAGAVLSGARLQDVQLSGCTAPLLALRMSSASHLVVTDSVLREADLYEATLEASRITGCDLSGADVTRAKVPELDLRGSRLDDLVGALSLRGAVVTPDQLLGLAPALAADAGITVVA